MILTKKEYLTDLTLADFVCILYGWLALAFLGRCGPSPHTLTLLKTKIADFPTLFKTEFRFLIRCLRHS